MNLHEINILFITYPNSDLTLCLPEVCIIYFYSTRSINSVFRYPLYLFISEKKIYVRFSFFDLQQQVDNTYKDKIIVSELGTGTTGY